MAILPNESLALLDSFAPVFTNPTYQRFLVLLGTAIITTGRRTVANLLRTAGALAPGHVSSYRRVFSQRVFGNSSGLGRWSEATNHQVDHCYVNHRFACFRVKFVVFAHPSVSPEPAERALDYPSTR
jgi:hypothetical protein